MDNVDVTPADDASGNGKGLPYLDQLLARRRAGEIAPETAQVLQDMEDAPPAERAAQFRAVTRDLAAGASGLPELAELSGPGADAAPEPGDESGD